MKTLKLFIVVLLAVLGLSLVAAQEDELQPGMAMYIGLRAATIRAEADNGAERLGPVEPGAVLTVIEVRDDGWVQVEHGDLQGWLRNPPLINVTEDDLVDPDDPLPPPTGPYKVGVTFRQWIDESRQDPWSDNPDDKRLLAAWIYYPADVAEGAVRMPYVMDESLIPVVQFFSEALLEGDFESVYGEISRWKAHAYRDAPISSAEDTYPVILFTGALSRSLQAVDLASHGYIVVDIDTTRNHAGYAFGSSETEMPDAEFSELNVEDNRSAIDYLAVLNIAESNDALIGRLDLDNIGVMGISIFGGIAWEIVRREERVRAGISIDGAFPFGTADLEKPFMYMIIEIGEGRIAYFQSAGPAHEILMLRNFAHDTPTDWLFWPEVASHRRVWPRGITPLRAHKIYTTYFLAFFDQYLKGIEQPLLDGPSDDFPEVTIESRNTD